jgi:hypothetical protein
VSPRIAYVPHEFSEASLTIIRQADAICRDYAAQGFDLTLRQLYYQFVARGLLPNTDRSYKRLGSIVNDARLAGLLDWNHVVDRTRNLRDLPHWDSPDDVVAAVAAQYRTDRWAEQPYRVEVWVEKAALGGVIGSTAARLDCPWFSCRGYTSQSELWGAAMRHRRYERNGQRSVVLHLGDHDPSGIDMSRDIRDRLALFGADVIVERIALNRDQVDRYRPPPNPAKLTDSRVAGYLIAHGESSWELDALDPATLDALIEENVLAYRDEDAWQAATERMERERSLLSAASNRWDEVADFLDEDAS